MKRTQIYLDEEQDGWLAVRAAETGRTKSELIREAIELYRRAPAPRAERLTTFRAAIEASLGTIPRLPAGAEYVRAIREGDLDRDRELERRWRG